MFVLLFVIFWILAIIVYRNEQKKYKGIEKIPGPLSLPLVGNSFSFGFSLIEHFKTLNDFHKTYGLVVRLWPIWFTPFVSVADPNIMEYFLNSQKHITKSRSYKSLIPWLGTGLLISTGAKWHRRRKIITPAFHFKILEQFVDVFNATGNILIEKLTKEVGKNSVNIYPFINHAALDMICETAMGTSINAQTSKESEYIKAVKKYLHLALKKEFSIWKNFDILYQYSIDYWQREKLLKTLHGFTHSIIVKRRKELQNKEELKLSEESGYKRKIAFLDLLLQATQHDGQPLSDEDIREEVDTFMFEGHDTVTSVLSFTLYEIAKNSNIQDKILEEVNTVLEGNYNQPLTYRILQDMSYTGLVIKEALRLYPSVPMYQRLLEEDVSIGKYTFPKGTTMAFNIFVMQRMAEYFPNPEVFDPSRFKAENLTGKNPFSYVPFSAGPRNCIGQKFAVLEMKATIAKILMKFKLVSAQPEHKLRLFNDSILKSENGVCIKLEPRKLHFS